MDDKIKQAAEAFGKALAQTSAVQGYVQAASEHGGDAEARRLKAELEHTYDALIQRQAAGEVISRGEIEAYYDLEQRVRANPLVARHEDHLEQVKDVFSDMHTLLSSHLGVNFKDLVD